MLVDVQHPGEAKVPLCIEQLQPFEWKPIWSSGRFGGESPNAPSDLFGGEWCWRVGVVPNVPFDPILNFQPGVRSVDRGFPNLSPFIMEVLQK